MIILFIIWSQRLGLDYAGKIYVYLPLNTAESLRGVSWCTDVNSLFCRFLMPSLFKFAVSLSDQHLQNSPLMGQITDILNKKFSTIDDVRYTKKITSSNL